MKILIPTMGTRGDVQPYIALSKKLINSGFEVTIATHPCWKELVESYQIKFVKLGPDIDIEYETARIRGNSKNWILGMIRTMKFVFRIIEESTFELKEICLDADLVIASHSNIGATEAEVNNIPYISVTLQPDVIPKKVEKRSKSSLFLNKFLGSLINPFMVGPYNKLRKRHGLNKITSFDQLLSPVLNIVTISPFVYPPNKFWEEKNKVVGYWIMDEGKNYKPDSVIMNFIKAGAPPVIICLGAMGFEAAEEKSKLDILINSINRTKMRAIIQGFNMTLENYQLGDNILSIGNVPHTWLFKHAYFVIHHGGMSTTATAFYSGVPSIVIPHITDQYFWAEKVYELKLGPKPVPNKELSEVRLIEAIDTIKEKYDMFHQSAKEMSEKIKDENGLDKTVELIKEVLRTK